MFCPDVALGHLVDEANPRADLTDVGWCRKIPGGLNVLGSRSDPLHCDLEAGNSTVSWENLNFSGDNNIPFLLQCDNIEQILEKDH